MKQCRVQAIEDVNLESPHGLEEELGWFYSEVCRLEPCHSDQMEASRLYFKSGRLRLVIHLSERPRIERMACRVTLLVPSLSEAVEALEQRKAPYALLSGLEYTDRRIQTADPGGNRVELKPQWPFAPL